MKYNVSFWRAPDWHRESSMDPTFLVVVGVVVAVLVSVGLVGTMMSRVQSVEAEIAALEIRGDQAADAVAEVKRQQHCVRFWSKALGMLDGVERNRLFWSRQLESLALSIPTEMTLSQLSVRAMEVPLELDEPRRRQPGNQPVRYGTQYEMGFDGVVFGEEAGTVIRQFSRGLLSSSGFEEQLDRVRLAGETPLSSREAPGKSFVLRCWYKPLDWQGESTAK